VIPVGLVLNSPESLKKTETGHIFELFYISNLEYPVTKENMGNKYDIGANQCSHRKGILCYCELTICIVRKKNCG